MTANCYHFAVTQLTLLTVSMVTGCSSNSGATSDRISESGAGSSEGDQAFFTRETQFMLVNNQTRYKRLQSTGITQNTDITSTVIRTNYCGNHTVLLITWINLGSSGLSVTKELERSGFLSSFLFSREKLTIYELKPYFLRHHYHLYILYILYIMVKYQF